MYRSKMLFISHSSSDIKYIQEIVSLMEFIGLRKENMVCSSVPDYGIPLGSDIYDWLKNKFKTYDLHVLFVLSKNFYSSAACLNEMGAAWVLRHKYDFILLPEFDFSDMKGAINANQIGIKIDGGKDEVRQKLGQLKDQLIEEFRLKRIPDIRWEEKREEFLEKIANINSIDCKKNTISLSKKASVLLAYASKDDNGEILVSSEEANGILYIATMDRFFTSARTVEDFKKWKEVLRELQKNSLIEEDKNHRGIVYKVTEKGYTIAEEIFKVYNFNTNKSPREYNDH